MAPLFPLRALKRCVLANSHAYRWRRELKYRRGLYDEPEVGLLPFLVDPSRQAVDVGAHTGLYVHAMLRLGAPVLAIEANPHLVEHLKRYYGRRARIEQVAISDTAGVANLRIPLGASGVATISPDNTFGDIAVDEVTTRTAKLDDICSEPVGFLKIDIEGHELAALRGATRLLQRDRPVVLVEAEERHRSGAVQSIRELLEPMGYRGLMIDAGRLAPIEAFDLRRDQTIDPKDVSALNAGQYQGRYINNFVFLS